MALLPKSRTKTHQPAWYAASPALRVKVLAGGSLNRTGVICLRPSMFSK